MTVLDASAVLVIQDVTGAEMVASRLDGSTISTVNLAEVVGKLVDAGLDGRKAVDLLLSAGVVAEPLTARTHCWPARFVRPGRAVALHGEPLLSGSGSPERPRGGARR